MAILLFCILAENPKLYALLNIHFKLFIILLLKLRWGIYLDFIFQLMQQM